MTGVFLYPCYYKTCIVFHLKNRIVMATKLKKYPKQPKANSSLKVWENYKKKSDAVTKYNSTILAERKKKDTIKSGVQKAKDRSK